MLIEIWIQARNNGRWDKWTYTASMLLGQWRRQPDRGTFDSNYGTSSTKHIFFNPCKSLLIHYHRIKYFILYIVRKQITSYWLIFKIQTCVKLRQNKNLSQTKMINLLQKTGNKLSRWNNFKFCIFKKISSTIPAAAPLATFLLKFTLVVLKTLPVMVLLITCVALNLKKSHRFL